MGLDLWFREDVARILASTHETMRASTAAWSRVSPRLATTYQQGFDDALRAVGIAFGIATPTLPRLLRSADLVRIVEAEDHYIRRDHGGEQS